MFGGVFKLINLWKKLFFIYQKDLRDELKNFDNLVATLVFGIMLVFIFSFSFQLVDVDQSEAFTAVLWVSIFFSAMLAIQRSFAKEKETGALDALLLLAGDRSLVFLAKSLCNLTVLLLFELVIVPVLLVFVEVQLSNFNLTFFIGTLVFGTWGLAVIGTMLNAMTVQMPSARLLFPILMFPLLFPLLIAVVSCTQGALIGSHSDVLGWFYFLLFFDILFTTVPFLLFDFVLEG